MRGGILRALLDRLGASRPDPRQRVSRKEGRRGRLAKATAKRRTRNRMARESRRRNRGVGRRKGHR